MRRLLPISDKEGGREYLLLLLVHLGEKAARRTFTLVKSLTKLKEYISTEKRAFVLLVHRRGLNLSAAWRAGTSISQQERAPMRTYNSKTYT